MPPPLRYAPLMKTRDKLKYAFATFLALATCAAIVAMVVAKQRRLTVPEDEQMRIRQTLATYGQSQPMPGANNSGEPVPQKPGVGEQAVPTPLAVQHGATQGDPAARP